MDFFINDYGMSIAHYNSNGHFHKAPEPNNLLAGIPEIYSGMTPEYIVNTRIGKKV